MVLSLDDAADFLPKYLSPKERTELFSELKSFPVKMSYYTTLVDEPLLQGDGWAKLDFHDVVSRTDRKTNACVISNSCDVSPDNRRSIPPRITIAPLVRLSRFVELLRSSGVAESSIHSQVEAIRKQEVTSIFFLPKGGGLGEDSVLFLDDLQSYPVARFFENDEKNRLFTLSQAGFWLFLIKLAIHFCRANESVRRGKE